MTACGAMAPTIGRTRGRDVRETPVGGVEHGPGDRVGLLLGPHDRRPRDELFGGRDHEHDGDDGDVVRADADDLRVIDVDAFRGRLELAQRVDGGERDEAVAGGGGDGAFRESDRLLARRARG